MRRLLSPSAGYSLLAFLCLFFCAPIVQYILGSQYARTVEAIRWLALLPLLKTIHYFVADSLTGAGYQGLRTLVQICVAVVNVLLNLWLIPNHSWRGAAWSSLASDGLLAVSLWCCAALLLHRNRPLMQITETVA
jgi:O-antigen/teichoic acid export membrane protein